MMQEVGGYLDYLALLGDSQAYDDVRIVIEGKSDAAKIQAMQNG